MPPSTILEDTGSTRLFALILGFKSNFIRDYLVTVVANSTLTRKPVVVTLTVAWEGGARVLPLTGVLKEVETAGRAGLPKKCHCGSPAPALPGP